MFEAPAEMLPNKAYLHYFSLKGARGHRTDACVCLYWHFTQIKAILVGPPCLLRCCKAALKVAPLLLMFYHPESGGIIPEEKQSMFPHPLQIRDRKGVPPTP